MTAADPDADQGVFAPMAYWAAVDARRALRAKRIVCELCADGRHGECVRPCTCTHGVVRSRQPVVE